MSWKDAHLNMEWLRICAAYKDHLGDYEDFLEANRDTAGLLDPELALPFLEPVHLAGVGAITCQLPDTPEPGVTRWNIAESVVKAAHQAACDPDPGQTLYGNGHLSLLFTAPIGPGLWAVCALQSHWIAEKEHPAHAIYPQLGPLRTTPELEARDPAELWANRPTDPRQIKADQEGRN